MEKDSDSEEQSNEDSTSDQKQFENLYEALSDKKMFEIIDEPIKVSPADLLLMLIKFALLKSDTIFRERMENTVFDVTKNVNYTDNCSNVTLFTNSENHANEFNLENSSEPPESDTVSHEQTENTTIDATENFNYTYNFSDFTLSPNHESHEDEISLDNSYESSDNQDTNENINSQEISSINNNVENTSFTSNSRKRKRNPNEWKATVAKVALNSGLAGTSKSGKLFQQKKMGPSCELRLKCKEKISNEERQQIFDNFWNLKDHNRQWDYIARMFTSTISKQWLTTIHNKQKLRNGLFIENDQRGKHNVRPKEVPENVIQQVRHHIEFFLKVESHYCRQTTTKEYLEEGLNIRKMYTLYLEWIAEINDENICTESYYRNIFTSCYNFDFHMPKKDQCDDCVSFNNLPEEEKNSAQDAHDAHINQKNTARELMNSDKAEDAKSNTNDAESLKSDNQSEVSQDSENESSDNENSGNEMSVNEMSDNENSDNKIIKS
ncbi:myb-like protein F [Leptopilina boulardi]|uniref:myb-like protein F n=1 Tax=Leptopilina boulardi TaxID=63433 RepID=UPI0021F638AC|nr:myb-like protein F [Leptopilina boulardi]